MRELSKSIARRDHLHRYALQRRRRIARERRRIRDLTARRLSTWPTLAGSFAAGWLLAAWRRRRMRDSTRTADEVVERINADTHPGSRHDGTMTAGLLRSLATTLVIRAAASHLLNWWNEATAEDPAGAARDDAPAQLEPGPAGDGTPPA